MALVFFAGAVRAEPEQLLRIGGTGGGLAAMRQLADAFIAQGGAVRVEVLPSLGSTGGIRALGEGAIEVAIIGRALTDPEQASGAAPSICWRTPFVFVTSHPVTFDLPIDGIARLYAEPQAVWQDGTPVRLILRPKVDADSLLLMQVVPGMTEALEAARRRPEIPVAATDQENLDLAQHLFASFTATTLTQLLAEEHELRVVTVGGVAPSAVSFTAGAYKLARRTCLILPASPTLHAAAFVRFLASDAAAPLLRRLALFPEPPS